MPTITETTTSPILARKCEASVRIPPSASRSTSRFAVWATLPSQTRSAPPLSHSYEPHFVNMWHPTAPRRHTRRLPRPPSTPFCSPLPIEAALNTSPATPNNSRLPLRRHDAINGGIRRPFPDPDGLRSQSWGTLVRPVPHATPAPPPFSIISGFPLAGWDTLSPPVLHLQSPGFRPLTPLPHTHAVPRGPHPQPPRPWGCCRGSLRFDLCLASATPQLPVSRRVSRPSAASPPLAAGAAARRASPSPRFLPLPRPPVFGDLIGAPLAWLDPN